MQAVQVSRHFRDHFDRAIDRGATAYRHAFEPGVSNANQLTYLADALQNYGEAFGIADVAITVSPSKDYTRWLDYRSRARNAAKHTQGLINQLGNQLPFTAAPIAASK